VLATATLMAMLPQVLFSPFTGALVDRWNRRAIMLAADSVIALATLLLAALFASGAIQVWRLYAIMFIRSVGGAFHWPAMQASTTLMVPKDQLTRVAGMNQTLYGVMGIVAPPIGALLVSALPMNGPLIAVLQATVAPEMQGARVEDHHNPQQ
jgi:DHA3 family macrolide efflux protein-like MFS transporter